ncbi:hypothetical protein [Streptomyces sp. NPDC048665]|uniref:hypothetical protein n=1 Tax=Streptomyces sp. NPDC048665 TaxID=3155490 RepID=UPI0034298772
MDRVVGSGPVLPPGVILLRVEGSPSDVRRLHPARLPGRPTAAMAAVVRAVRDQFASPPAVR